MNEGFISFKKKILKEHLTKCLILSISLGLIVFGGLFLLWKLQAISLPIWMVIIIPVACFIISFCGPYFLLKPCDKRIAKRLDHELKLNEKVQTMVDYKDSDEFIACLQREDTENKLKAISLKALKFNLPIALIVLGVIGVASTTTAVSIPMKHEQSPVEPEKPFTLTELQIKRIEEIIAKVKESNINSELTSSYENELNALIEKLKVITKQDTVNEEVLKTIEKITKEMNDTNKNKAIGKALNSIESTFYDDNGKFKPVSSRKNAFVGKWMTNEELANIVKRTSKVMSMNITDEAALELAKRSRKTPRIANRLFKRVRDFALVEGDGLIDLDITLKALDRLNVDAYGLDNIDIEYLEALINKFNGGPVGVETISTAIGEEISTIEDVVEPFLLQEGFIKRTRSGRVATEFAYKHLGIDHNMSLF